MTVPFRAFRILVGGTVPFRSVPFRILVTTLSLAWAGEGGVASGNECALALGTRLWDWNKVSKVQ